LKTGGLLETGDEFRKRKKVESPLLANSGLLTNHKGT